MDRPRPSSPPLPLSSSEGPPVALTEADSRQPTADSPPPTADRDRPTCVSKHYYLFVCHYLYQVSELEHHVLVVQGARWPASLQVRSGASRASRGRRLTTDFRAMRGHTSKCACSACVKAEADAAARTRRPCVGHRPWKVRFCRERLCEARALAPQSNTYGKLSSLFPPSHMRSRTPPTYALRNQTDQRRA